MPNNPTLSEDRFDRYLAEHGYDAGVPEPDLGVETRPDRLVERAGTQVVCEIKEFTKSPLGLGARLRTLSSTQWYKPVRKAVQGAAGQLRPLKDSGLPLVVVISNPHGVAVPLDTEDVILALYGDPTYTVRVNTSTGAAVGQTAFGAGRNGRLTNYHPYISGVVILRERSNEQDFVDELARRLHGHEVSKTFEEAGERGEELIHAVLETQARGEVPEGSYCYVDAIKTMSADAVELPHSVFDGPRDSRWEYDAGTGGYVKVR